MAERWIEIVVSADAEASVRETLQAAGCRAHVLATADGTRLLRCAIEGERVEALGDALAAELGDDGYHLIVMPLLGARPKADDDEQAPQPTSPASMPVRAATRVSRDELIESLGEDARISRVFFVMVALSAVVAAIGLSRNSPAIVIGAMVIAPLLGPHMALALATVLAEARIARHALGASLAGGMLTFLVALAAGRLLHVEPTWTEVTARATVSAGEVVLALASGAAGAIAVTRGASTSLVGVMVAVALVPPLVTSGMLWVRGHGHQALQALLLTGVNVVCINLAAVVTFRLRGVRPRTSSEDERASRATLLAALVWLALLILAVALIWLGRQAAPTP